MSRISCEEVLRLASLARLRLTGEEAGVLAKDIAGILEHVRDLEGVPTEGVPAMTGGTDSVNIVRDDEASSPLVGKGVQMLPEVRRGYLVVPPVFGTGDREV